MHGFCRCGLCVFNVQYRVHNDGGVYPQGQEDAYAALLWLAQGSHAGRVAQFLKSLKGAVTKINKCQKNFT